MHKDLSTLEGSPVNASNMDESRRQRFLVRQLWPIKDSTDLSETGAGGDCERFEAFFGHTPLPVLYISAEWLAGGIWSS